MKRFFLGCIVLITMLFASLTFAAAPTTQGYASKQIAGTQMPRLVKAAGLLPTNIVIINFSDHFLHVGVYGTSIDQPINSGGTGIITNDRHYGNTHLLIYDGGNRLLFENLVCHYSIMVIDGGPYPFKYTAVVDNSYC